MSRIKELKNNPSNSLNLVTFIESILPDEVNEPKYVETLLRIMKSDKTHSKFYNDWKQIKHKFGFNNSTDDLPMYAKYFFYVLALTIENESKEDFIEFCKDNESGLIEQKDLSRYHTFQDIKEQVKKSREKKEESLLSKQAHKIHEDNEWLILRPLTFLASRKYGSGTKWCTTELKSPSYFVTRRNNGILIYCINKKTNEKVAFEYNESSSYTNKPTLNVWTAQNNKIDSFESGLPSNILSIVYSDIKESKYRTNKSLMDQEMIKSDEKYISSLDDETPF